MERWRVRRDWLRFSRALHVTPKQISRSSARHRRRTSSRTLPQPEWICYCAGVGRRSASSSSSRTGSGAGTCIRPDTSVDRLRHRSRRRTLSTFTPSDCGPRIRSRLRAPQDQAHVSYSIPNISSTPTHFTAVCRRPSSVMRELGHDRIDLLKLNIEGEYGVRLAGRGRALSPLDPRTHARARLGVGRTLSGASARGAGLRSHSRVPDVRHVASLRARASTSTRRRTLVPECR